VKTYPSVDEIIDSITGLCEDLPEQLRITGARGNTPWTYKLKEDIGNLGDSKEFDVCPRKYESYKNPAWLYDLVWYTEDDEHHLNELFLALESEWGNQGQVKYDFEKLLQSKATLKVMIFQAPQSSLQSLIDFMVDGIKAFPKHSEDETYLLIGLNLDTHGFEFLRFNGFGVPART
jgi:hypothetical protein